MSNDPEDTKIPISSWPFFQEYDVSRLDVRQHEALIIERILAYGNREEVRWVLKTYGRSAVRSWVEELGAHRLSKRRYHLWCFVFKVPEKERSSRIWPH